SAPGSLLIIASAIPVTDQVFMEVSFTYSPNNGILPRELDRYAFPKTEMIEQSFKLDYANGNPMSGIVGGEWLQSTNTELMNQHADEILTLFYGPNPRAEIERLQREAAGPSELGDGDLQE